MSANTFRDPLKCEICYNMTNGYDCKGHILCAYCLPKYDNVPNHIPIKHWGKYVKIARKKDKDRKVPLL